MGIMFLKKVNKGSAVVKILSNEVKRNNFSDDEREVV
jgi:hypothetical protein